MHITKIAAYGLLAIGAIAGFNIIVMLIFTVGTLDADLKAITNSQGGLRFLLIVFIWVVCWFSGQRILRLVADDVNSSAIAVSLLALIALALDFYAQGHLYLTGDFGPAALAMLVCAALLAASKEDYQRARADAMKESASKVAAP